MPVRAPLRLSMSATAGPARGTLDASRFEELVCLPVGAVGVPQGWSGEASRERGLCGRSPQALKDLIDAIHVHILAGHELVAAGHRRPVLRHGACRMTAVGRGRPLRRRPNGMGGRRR